MSTWNPKQMTEGAASAAAAAVPMPAEHVCTPACTHEGAKPEKQELSAPGRVKGTLHVSARASRPDGDPTRGGS
jgi:hypothetical protein